MSLIEREWTLVGLTNAADSRTHTVVEHGPALPSGERVEVVDAAAYRGAVSDVARARGLAEALVTCPDDHTVEGVREIGAEIVALLARVGGQ